MLVKSAGRRSEVRVLAEAAGVVRVLADCRMRVLAELRGLAEVRVLAAGCPKCERWLGCELAEVRVLVEVQVLAEGLQKCEGWSKCECWTLVASLPKCECWPKCKCWPRVCRSASVGRVLAECCSSVGRVSAECRPSVVRVLVDCPVRLGESVLLAEVCHTGLFRCPECVFLST